MHTALLGTDFRKASLEVLEKIYFEDEKIKSFFRKLSEQSPIKEMVVLATCNRMEIYYTCIDFVHANEWLQSFVSDFFDVDESMLGPIFYHNHCLETIDHLFSVSSGTQSMVFGESEILGQVKSAYQFCSAISATGAHLNKLFQSAIATGKRVREETNISKGGYSISSIAVESMRENIKNLQEKKILVVGAGTMSIRAIKKLKAIGVNNIYLCNRTPEKGLVLAHEFDMSYMPYADLSGALKSFDVIYFATSAKIPIFLEKHVSLCKDNVLIVDVGLPRNVAANITSNDHLKVVTIDDLEDVANRTLKDRRAELDKINKIIYTEVANFVRWYDFRRKKLSVDLCLDVSE